MAIKKNTVLRWAAWASLPLIGCIAAKQKSGVAKSQGSNAGQAISKGGMEDSALLSLKKDTATRLTQTKIIVPENAYKKIFGELRTIIVAKLGVDSAEVTPQASFTNDLGADSLDTIELVMEAEKFYSISIPDEQAEKATTVHDGVLLIYKITNNIK